MRPKQLTMIAFGPYGERQVIDFDKLTDSNIFLIHGPTGSGKTTILDAMCYALYGYTNGGERSAENMRSKFARPEQGAEVELIFTVLDKTYKVFRSPKFERPKLKGKGTTEQLPKVNLSEWDGEKFVTLSEKQQDVDKKINELLRFNIDQFRQVIMIAQNKFRELLTVDSKERQKILQDIFETGMYESIEQKIDQMNNRLEESLKIQEINYSNMLSQIEHEEEEVLTQYIETKVLKNAPQVVEILKGKCQLKEEAKQSVEKELQSIREQLESLQNQLIVQTEQYNALIQKQEVEKKLKETYEQKEHYDKLKQQVIWGEKVMSLIPLEEAIKEIETQLEETSSSILLLQEEQTTIIEKLIVVEKQRKEAEEKLPYVEKLKKQYSILETYLSKVEELLINKERKEKLIQEIDKTGQEVESKNAQIQKGKNYIEEAQNKIAYKEELNKELAKLQLYKSQVQQVLVIKQDIELREKELVETRNKYTVITKEVSKLKQEEEIITQEHDTLFEAWLQNQAGEIAKILEVDKPCPVCGSIEHPHKAEITHAHVDLEEIRKREADKLRINGTIRQKLEEQSNIKELGIRLRSEQENLKLRAVELIAEYEQITNQTKQDIEMQVRKLEEQINQINRDQQKMQDYKIKVINLEQEKEKLELQLKEKQIQLGQINSKIEEVQKELPKELHSKEALSNKLISIQNEYKTLERVYEESGKNLEAVKSEQTKNVVSLQEKQKNQEALVSQKAQKSNLFEEALKQSHFENIEQYKEAKTYLNQIDTTKQMIEAYYTNQAVLENSLKELEEKTKGFKIEELEAVKTKYNESFNQKEEEQNKWNKIVQYVDKHQTLSKQIEDLYATSMEIIRKQSIIGSVAVLAKGKNSKGLSFERYIQSSIFEQVLRSANNKLKPMTGSRYELQRTEDRQDKRKQAGLDITVKDNYVGQTRPVNTLSGGESFMAALALALGLSEVIQRLAGATSLDTMFIDEGFGTLDEEALDLAIKTLLNLGNTGRLVGIISHVKELREQIPARLEIIATNTGSRAEFKI